MKSFREPLTSEQLDLLNGNDIVFQALSWHEDDFAESSSGEGSGEEENEQVQYQIYVHGSMADGKSVCLKIKEFVPYFYIMIPEKFQLGWSQFNTKQVFKYFRQILGKKNSYGLVTSTLVEKCKLYPFENLRKLKFIRLGFCTQRAMKTLKYKIKGELNIPGIGNIKFEPYETNVQSVLRFTHIKNIKMTGWITIKAGNFTIVGDDDEISRSQISIVAKWNDVNPYDCDQIAPFLILSYDLECYSSRGYPKFPEADIKGDFISQIGCALWRFGPDTPKKQIVFTCIKSDPVEGVTIVNCPSEKSMLKSFCLLIEKEDPDMITGYNTWGFDDTYLWNRLVLHELDSHYEKMSRIVSLIPKLTPRTMSSGAYGHNQFNIISMYGRESFDVCFATRREYKLNSFKLDSVAEHFLKLNKVNISIRMGYDTEDTPIDKRTNGYKLLFEIIDRKDPKELAIVCDYCAHDSLLPLLLIEKLCFIPNYIEMAKSTRVPIDWLLLRGQQCKVFSQIVYEARKRDFVVPVFEYGENSDDPEEKYKGATVLHANTGAYFEPVAGLDFKSLYPSIMIAYNMCHSTIVIDDKYRNLPGIEYETIEWYEEDKDKKFSFTFVQNVKGLLPSILEQLWEERNATKKEMKKHKGTFHEMVLNGKQLAIKVTMNSAYGFAGASKGILPCKPIAASVTAKGREMIARTSKMAQEFYNCVTTYGDTDSCYVKFFVARSKYETENDYLEEHFRLAQECANKITASFKKPIELEFEKIMYPFFLYKKKRYAYNEWVRDKTGKIVSEGISSKGIELVRRDFCEYVKDTGQSILDALMYDKDKELAKSIASKAVSDLLEDRVPIKKLIISKSLNDVYKVDGCEVPWDDPRVIHPHVHLAQRIKLVDPMNHPKPPDRVPYVFMCNKNKHSLQYEKVEHPDYIQSTQKIDALYYFEHQLKNCIDGLLEVIIDDTEQLYKDQVAKRTKIDAKLYVLEGNRDIRNFFTKKS